MITEKVFENVYTFTWYITSLWVFDDATELFSGVEMFMTICSSASCYNERQTRISLGMYFKIKDLPQGRTVISYVYQCYVTRKHL